MNSARRREREARDKRRLILDTAMKLFLEEGYENITLRRIAERIEYSPAAIYLYYKGKKEILYALHEKGFEMLYRRQKTVLSIKDPWKRLKKHGKLYVAFALENPEYYDLMFIMKAPAEKIKEKEKWESGLRSYELFKENVKQCIEAGYLKQADLDTVTFSLWALVHGIASLVIRERCAIYPEEYLGRILDGAQDYTLDNIRKGKENE